MVWKIELRSHVLRYQADILGVPGDVAPHEWAERQHGQAGGACFGQRRANQLRAEPPVLKPRIDDRVYERDQARAATVLGVPSRLPVDADLEARALGQVDDLDVRGGSGSFA